MITIGHVELDLKSLDGREIYPGVRLIGVPTWDEQHREWRCLANCYGALALVALSIKVSPSKPKEITS